MKIIRYLALALALAAFVPATSYAIVDAGIYGGYSFSGEIDAGSLASGKTTTGWEYAFIGHVNFDFLAIFNLGIGAFYQNAPLKFDVGGETIKVDNVTIGPDIYLELDLPVIPIHPYVRGGIAAYNKTTIDLPSSIGNDVTAKKYFSAYYFGLGAALTIFPFVQIFGEYMYNYANQEKDVTLSGNAVHLGARLNI
ncbi:MAG: hypothetical protein EPN93_21380 [Spirochaetes bacterium]|nr:MAG: hypothetical protein EPN93_21380 [Spirochaetota bacterium]